MTLRTILAAILSASLTLLTSTAAGLNQSTHAIVNEEAARQSTLDTALKNRLGVSEGIEQLFRGQGVLAWLREGGVREDDGVRFFRHFHDPIKPWASAGLTFFGQYQSSIQWMQRPTDRTNCQDWTWSSARCYFYRALSGLTSAEREQAWADTFRAVGQLMHLVVDASVPEHTRNDPHPFGGLFGSYEYWVERLHPDAERERGFVTRYLSTPEWPDPRLVEEPTNDFAAPVPVARLIDADLYTGADPNVTTSSPIGIAEFANANFFSEDSGYRRLFAPIYPHPSVEGLVPSPRPVPGGSRARAYYKKGPGDGLPVDPVLAECALDAAFRDDGIPTPQYKCTDANVWEQAALAMLPRAVGYAAALIDYFFRGQLEAQLLPPEGDGSNRRLRIVNPATAGTPGERMTGTFSLYYDAADGTRVPLASWANQDLVAGARTEVAIPPPPADAPPPVEPGLYLLVFKGQLGNEPEAVAASWVDGRVWVLQLGATTYDRDWTLTSPPTLEPQTFPAGPTHSRFLYAFDPTLGFSGAYVARPHVVHIRSQIYPWTCEGANYSPRLLGAPVRGDQHQYVAWYRGRAVPWGNTASLALSAYGTSVGPSYTPVIVEVVRFVEPRSLEELHGYSYDNPPTVEAVLYETVLNSRDPVEVGPVALNGATFIGLSVRPLPNYPTEVPDASPNGPMDYLCFRLFQQFGPLPFLGGTPVSADSTAVAELRIPLSP